MTANDTPQPWQSHVLVEQSATARTPAYYYLAPIPPRREHLIYGGDSLTGPDPESLRLCIRALREGLGK